ncbi:MAG: 50S ribosomal protein L13 [Deltaproteobacteria bacterium]
MKSYMAKAESIQRKWYVIDAEGKPLGRLATEIARILRGKHKPTYTPHMDAGDHVIVLNCEKVLVTGNKESQKIYRHFSGYIGGMKETSFKDMIQRKPDRVIYHAVKGMLPKNSLGRAMIRKLRIYSGTEHNHEAQKPEVLDLKF